MQKNHGPAVSAIIRTRKGSSPEKARPSSTYFGSMYGRARKLHRDPSEGIPNGPSAPLFISPTRTPEGHKKFYTLRLDAVRATAQQLQAKDLGLLVRAGGDTTEFYPNRVLYDEYDRRVLKDFFNSHGSLRQASDAAEEVWGRAQGNRLRHRTRPPVRLVESSARTTDPKEPIDLIEPFALVTSRNIGRFDRDSAGPSRPARQLLHRS
jgi:hypothetical protein